MRFSRVRRAALVAAIVFWAMLPVVAHACLAEFRSVDEQAAESPLILIGVVESVEEFKKPKPIGPQKAKRFVIPFEPSDDAGGDKPTIATVRVIEVIQGTWKEKQIRVHSGPIRSCAPYAVHYTFKVGQTQIFMFAYPPSEGVARLTYGGSMLPASDRLKVESRIARAKAFKEAYIARLRTETPKVYEAAVAVGKVIRDASARCEALPKDEDGFVADDKAYEALKEELIAKLKPVSIDAIIGALAIDWLDPQHNWAGQVLWLNVANQLRDRSDEIAAAEKLHVARQLRDANVGQKEIDAYISALKDSEFSSISFPRAGPHPWRGNDGTDLSTDFIYRFHDFDRGRMFAIYGMSMERLGSLDPKRTAPIIAAMFGSDDDSVRLIAWRAIERIPGDHFASLVLESMSDRSPSHWRALVNDKDKAQTEQRIRSLVAAAQSQWTAWGQAGFWSLMRQGECYEPAALELAIAALAKLEGDEKEDKGDKDDRKHQAQSLRKYLENAARQRAASEPKSAADYSKLLETGK